MAQLEALIAGTAHNSSGVGPFTGGFSNPPTQAEMQEFSAWVETLRGAPARECRRKVNGIGEGWKRGRVAFPSIH